MTFNWATMHVADMKRSLDFYCGLLKLPIARQIGEPADETCIVFLGEEGKTQLELIQNKTVPSPTDTMFVGLTLDNLEEVVAACKESASQSANGKFWYVKDPDGYRIQLK